MEMNNMQNGNHSGQNVCKCQHHNIVPIAIALIGIVFLLGGLNILSSYAVDIIWPILVIVIGVVKMKSRSCKCC